MKKMKIMKQGAVAAMIAAMAFSMTACGGSSGSDGSVTVQSVSMLMGMDMVGLNRYTGVAEAKSTINITKDSSKTVAERYVEVGQEVKEGDLLFTYDQEALDLSVETAELEIEQMENQIDTYESQIEDLESQKKSTSDTSEKLEITLQIQDTQLDMAKEEYDLKLKKADFEKLKASVSDADVRATADGVIKSIKDDSAGSDSSFSDSDDSEGSGTEVYMTIMETGTYKIKGTVSELNLAYIYEEEPVTVVSRTDDTQMWSGTITKINTDATDDSSDSSTYDFYGSSDSSEESASKYSFYVEVENSDGMMMGQHVYIIPDVDYASDNTIELPAAYIVQEDGNAYVWAASGRDKLEYRQITLGEYNAEADTYEITDGLTLDDYIAMPASGLKAGTSVVKVDSSSEEDDADYSDEDLSADEEYYEEESIDGEMSEDEYIDETYSEDESMISEEE